MQTSRCTPALHIPLKELGVGVHIIWAHTSKKFQQMIWAFLDQNVKTEISAIH
jgi:hypothetical protein